MAEPTRRTVLRTGAFVLSGLTAAGPAAAQPVPEEEEEIPMNVKISPAINPQAQGLLPVIVAFDPGIGTTPGLIDSLVLGPLRAEPEHAAHVDRFKETSAGGDSEDVWKVHFDPKTADTWFRPGDTEAFVQTTTDPILRDEDPVKVVTGRKLPDLIPTDVSREDTDMVVTVENQGSRGAKPSTTQVEFGSHGTSTQSTPALDPGETVQLSFAIPSGCFDPDCDFTISVDVDTEVVESDEENNDLSGTFIG